MTAPAAARLAPDKGLSSETWRLGEHAVRGELPAVLLPCALLTLWPAQLSVVWSPTPASFHSQRSVRFCTVQHAARAQLADNLPCIPSRLSRSWHAQRRPAVVVYSYLPAVLPPSKHGRRAAGPVRTLDCAVAAEQVQALLQRHAAGAEGEPLLIKGAAAHWPALRTWSLDWLVRHHGRERHGPWPSCYAWQGSFHLMTP